MCLKYVTDSAEKEKLETCFPSRANLVVGMEEEIGKA